MSTLTYCDNRHDYYVDDWLVASVMGAKALLQKRDGKKILLATFAGGRVTEQKIGSTQDCGGPFMGTSKGWVLCE